MRITYWHLVSASLVALTVCALLPKLSLAQVQEQSPKWTLNLKPGQSEKKIFATLKNVSKNPQWAIQVNDGSESGWREPTVTWEVQVFSDGKWTPAPKTRYGRCGLYANQWQKDVVRLESGQSLELAMEWIGHPEFRIETTIGQRYRARLHYSYAGGVNGKGRSGPSVQMSVEYGPKYEVVSEWLEL